jgi:RNA polymerase sigma-70 factor (ECF subfamily)
MQLAFPLAPILVAPAFAMARPQLRVVASSAPKTEADLVTRLQRGDRDAEEELYRTYVRHVLGLATRLLGRRSDAEDVAQDTFVIAFEQIHQLRDAGALKAWVTQIAVSQVRRRFRKRKLLSALGLHIGADDATLESLSSKDASPDTRAELSSLDRVLATLPSEQRVAWMLRYVEGEELEAVASACGCSLATIKRRISAADAQVRAEVRMRSEA